MKILLDTNVIVDFLASKIAVYTLAEFLQII